ncbi:uncharacterized protein LOC141697316 [Apium graveolens]|uniref:uncharacterized protein LOC141697316 n=1 Tax=Apium graveolens TaxID=4045 RepID=UPI003D7AAA14
MHEDLKSENLEAEDPFILWENLKNRFDHHKLIYLLAAENDWANFRLQDFKSVRAYNSALFKISYRLIICGEKVIEKRKIDKTLSTFHPNNINLAEMYMERKFTKFGDLLSTLLVAEQNHELNVREKGIEVDGAKVGTVDDVVAMGISVHITTLVTGSGNLNHRVKERHHDEEKLKMFAIGAA